MPWLDGRSDDRRNGGGLVDEGGLYVLRVRVHEGSVPSW